LRRIIMSNLSGNGPTNEYSNRPVPTGRATSSWMIPAAVVAAVIVVGVGYGYESGWMNSASVVDRKAVTTDTSSPSVAGPMTPAASPKP
jgi:hypothetical protein